MKTIKRYWKVYNMLLRLNLAQLFAYRASLINSIFSHFVWSAFVIILMLLLTSRVSSVYGWTRNELLVVAGAYNIIYSIFYFFFSRNLNEFSRTVHFGRLDSILTKPIDTQFLMSCAFINYTQVIRLILGIGFLSFMLWVMHVPLTLMSVLGFLLFSIISVMIIYSFSYAIMTITIWFTNLSNLTKLLYHLNHIGRYPPEMYKGASMGLFIAVFPLTLVIIIPVKILLQKVTLGETLLTLAIAIVMLVGTRLFWRYALRSYTSASG